jgi:chaperonin GroEL
VISEELGLSLEKATVKDLGRACKIIISKENSTIIDGAGEADTIQSRIKQIKAQIERPPPTTTARSCRSVSPSSPAVLR